MDDPADPTNHVLALIRENRWEVDEARDDGRFLFVARKPGIAMIVRSDDRYAGACELAQRCEIDLEG